MCVVSHIHWPHVSPCSTWMVSSKVHMCGDEEPVDPVAPVDPIDPVDPVEFRKAPVGESDGPAKRDRCSVCLIPAAPHLSEQERNRVIPMVDLNIIYSFFIWANATRITTEPKQNFFRLAPQFHII